MEIRVPVFAGRRILKKESLWDIRDYTYAGWQLYYAEYTDGLLKGCDIRAEDGRLVIGKGMLKFHDFIYLMMEEERVDYQPKNRWQVLKAEFLEDETNLDYKAYRVRFFLDEEMELGENQIWNAKEKETSDFIFSYMIESNKGRMERQAITRYLQDKNRKESEKDLSVWDNNMIYTELERILRHRGVGRGKGYDRKMIYVE